jgi:2-iminobutanoate/2-iminopropanoate deaminase
MKRINPENGTGEHPLFSAAIISNGLVFVSGQASINPDTGEVKLGDVRSETELTLQNVKRALEAAGTDLDHVIKCNIYLQDINDYHGMNEVYARFFVNARPARTTIQAILAFGLRVEIDAIAELPEP